MTTGPCCPGCVQQPYGGGFVTFSGTGASGIMCVGESPWTDELAARTPFAGAAGAVFDRLLYRAHLNRNDVWVTNSAWCKARRLGWYDSRDPDASLAMAACRPHLDGLIERLKPRVLVPMGNVALRRVCGVSGIESQAGYVLDSIYGIPVVPTYHPSFIMQGNQKLSPVVIFALARAKEIAQHGFTRSRPTLLLDPPVDRLRAYCEATLHACQGSIPSLFIDLETPESAKLDEEEVDEKGASWQIIRASFALEEGVAVSFPWAPPFREILSMLLSQCNEVVEWATNHFDTRRLVRDGVPCPDRRVSALWAWHWLQSDLRKGLEVVAPFFGADTPWKHTNTSDPAYYSAMDSLIGRQCYEATKAALVKAGRWQSFERHCVQCDPILAEMGKQGVLVDVAERTQFMGAIKAEHQAAFDELQTVIPVDVLPRQYYKRLPDSTAGVFELCPGKTQSMAGSGPESTSVVTKESTVASAVSGGLLSTALVSTVEHGSDLKSITSLTKAASANATSRQTAQSGDLTKSELSGNSASASCSAMNVTERKQRKPKVLALSSMAPDTPTSIGSVNALSAVQLGSDTAQRLELPKEPCSDLLWATGYRYVRRKPFLPSSWQQVQDLAAALKVKLPKKRDAEDDDDVTTERKYLLAPARKHRAFRLVLDCRERGKLLSTYNWPLDAAGRATTIFGWHPSTLRKSSRSVNLQNIPKRSKLAEAFRRMIVAAPGHLLVEADFSAIEAVLVGWFAGSSRYISLAKAGVHGWLTSALHGSHIPLDSPDLASLCRAAKKTWHDDYEKCKRVVHLSNYKGTPQRMAEEYPDEFPDVKGARRLQNFYFDTAPGQDVRAWQDRVCLQAAHDCYLDNPYGYRHWFYEVSHYDKRREKFVAGEDAKRAVAFLPQSTASAIQSEVLLRLAERIREWLRLIIHDSFLCEAREDAALDTAKVLGEEMLNPIPELGGLTIGVEISVGRNWAPWHAEHNPDGMQVIPLRDLGLEAV